MYRRAVASDCKRIYDLICEMENKKLPYDKFCAIYQNQLRDSKYYCLVCEYDGDVVGVLNLRIEEQLHHAERVAEIMEFIVDAKYRKHSIGKEMFMQICQVVIDCGCAQIEVACNQLRSDTHRFYLREGMQNFHFKFSKVLNEQKTSDVNKIGR